MRRERQTIVPISLREAYVQPGDYSAKLMIDPEVSPEIETVTLTVRNADGTPLKHDYRRWGTKLNLSFTIDSSTPDGVVTIDIHMAGRGRKLDKRFSFWVVK